MGLLCDVGHALVDSFNAHSTLSMVFGYASSSRRMHAIKRWTRMLHVRMLVKFWEHTYTISTWNLFTASRQPLNTNVRGGRRMQMWTTIHKTSGQRFTKTWGRPFTRLWDDHSQDFGTRLVRKERTNPTWRLRRQCTTKSKTPCRTLIMVNM